MHRLQHIESARQAVLGGGHVPSGVAVAPWIVQSWQRCLSLGHQPQHQLGFDVVTAQSQRHSAQENHALVQAAHAILEQLGQVIAKTRYFALLTNAKGIVVQAGGSIDRSDRRADLISRLGVDLSEFAVGTTAIGTTLIGQQSTWLHRGEHFFNDTQHYSCAGAPIFGPNGQCMGMLDVTGIEVPERPELVHLVASSARAIENQLVLAKPHALVVHLHWLGHAGRDNEGLVCLDADGTVSAMNALARDMLGVAAAPARALHASELFALQWQRLFDASHHSDTLHAPLWSGLMVGIRTSKAGKFLPKGSAMTADSAPLKDQETLLIRRTVLQHKGNVAAAARALGVSRATVYRKLGMKKTSPQA